MKGTVHQAATDAKMWNAEHEVLKDPWRIDGQWKELERWFFQVLVSPETLHLLFPSFNPETLLLFFSGSTPEIRLGFPGPTPET